MNSNKKVRILMIDDEKDIVEILSEILEDMDCDVTSFSTEVDIDQIQKEEYDVVFLDFNNPHTDPIKLFNDVLIHKDLYVLIYTGYGTIKNVQKFKQLGIHGIMHKPVDIQHISTLIESLKKIANLPKRIRIILNHKLIEKLYFFIKFQIQVSLLVFY